MRIQTYARNAMMDFTVTRMPLVLLVPVIVCLEHCVTDTTVHVVKAATSTGQESSVIYRALPDAESATSLTNHLVHCAKMNCTV